MSRDVVFVLLLVQAAAGVLAAFGELALMASPLYLVLPLLKAAALLVIAGRVARGRRWALVVTIVIQWLGLLGAWFGLLLGLFPALDPTLTLTGLLTELALPAALILGCARLLTTPDTPTPTRRLPMPPRPPATHPATPTATPTQPVPATAVPR